MATNEYLEAFLEKAKELLPNWMWKKIYNEALPKSGGKARANRLKDEIEKEELVIKPEPREDEGRDEFIDRFMNDEKAMEDFPDEEQRLAVAVSMWENRDNPTNKDNPEFEIGDLVTSDDDHFNEYNPYGEVIGLREDYIYTIEFEDSDIPHEFAGQDLERYEEIKGQKNKDDNLDKLDKTTEGRIISKQDEQQLIYGVVLEPEQVDAQGDIISAEEIEKTAHLYLKRSRIVGDRHIKKAEASVVESYIAPTDFTLNDELVIKGSWVLVTKIEDEQLWQEVKQGSYNAFSIGAYGKRE